MLESVVANGHKFEECKEELKASAFAYISAHKMIGFLIAAQNLTDITLDSGFKDFYQYCKSHDIPVVIISRYIQHFFRLGLPCPISDHDLHCVTAVWPRSSVRSFPS